MNHFSEFCAGINIPPKIDEAEFARGVEVIAVSLRRMVDGKGLRLMTAIDFGRLGNVIFDAILASATREIARPKFLSAENVSEVTARSRAVFPELYPEYSEAGERLAVRF